MKENIQDDPSVPLRRVHDQSVVVARKCENAPPAIRRKWRRLEHRIQQRPNQSGSILASNYTFDIEHYITMLGFYFMFLANNRCYDKSFIKK